MADRILKWAVIGTGYIAGEFARGMEAARGNEIAAVVSRSREKAEEFARNYGGKPYDDYEAMLEEVRPDVVYAAVPNDCHIRYILPAIEAGIHVLSEKPMADNQKQLERIFLAAKEKQVFVMEGMWTRCFPAVKQARKWIDEGRIGKPLTVNAMFDIHTGTGEWQTWKAGIAHAGGALRDVGIYSLAMAHMVFQKAPARIYSNVIKNGEVDVSTDLMLCYSQGQTAHLSGSFIRKSSHEVWIAGERGHVVIGPEFWHPKKAVLELENGTKEIFDDPYKATGFQYEIEEAAACIREGRKESSEFTWEDSRNINEIIEQIRREWNIIYQSDEQEN